MSELETRLADTRQGIDLLGRHIQGLPLQELLLGGLLKLATDGIGQRFADALRPHGLSESEFLTLMQLFIRDDAISPADLCLLVDQTRANMTHIAGALARRGFITRVPSRRDRRRIELRVTPTGRSFVRALLPQVFRPVRAALAGLSVEQRRTLQTLLQTVVASIDAAPEVDCQSAPRDVSAPALGARDPL